MPLPNKYLPKFLTKCADIISCTTFHLTFLRLSSLPLYLPVGRDFSRSLLPVHPAKVSLAFGLEDSESVLGHTLLV